MRIFPFRKKKSGTSSNISKLRSPYLKKISIPERLLRRHKKKPTVFTPTNKIKGPRKRHPVLWLLLFLTISGASTYLILFSHFFDVKAWEAVEDGIRLEKEDPVNQILASERNNNLFFINESQLIQKIKMLHPDIQKVEIKKIFPQKIKVQFEKYPIAANIINKVGKTQKKLLVDSIGLIVDQNNENPGLPYLKIESVEALEIGALALAPEKLDYILKSMKAFEQQFTMKVIDAEYKAREREVHLRTEKYFAVWLDMEKPFERQLEKLKKGQSKLDIYNTPLEYIDLRISGTDNEKIIFKRRGGGPPK